jgi:hypothetical protein
MSDEDIIAETIANGEDPDKIAAHVRAIFEKVCAQMADGFRLTGSAPPGMHCSYCPKRPDESCQESCMKNYEAIEAERAKDGVKVTDHT